MSQRDGFASGFFLGAFVGGILGGVLGAVVISRRDAELADEQTESTNNPNSGHKVTPKKRQMRAAADESAEIEIARRSLEDKIAQLNDTIDEVRNQLGTVNNT
jgi:TolA-binding protein